MPTYRTQVGSGNTIELPSEPCEQLGIVAATEVEFFLTLDASPATAFGMKPFDQEFTPLLGLDNYCSRYL